MGLRHAPLPHESPAIVKQNARLGVTPQCHNQPPTGAARVRRAIFHAMNSTRRLAIFGIVIVAAIALFANQLFLVHMPQLNYYWSSSTEIK
jgi:hypothetical protein